MNTGKLYPRPGQSRRVPTPILALLLSGGLLCGLALLMLLAPGCASTPGPDRSTRGSTETAARGGPIVVTVAPPPWNSIAEAALGLISAGLATWNVQQHRRLAALEAVNPAHPREQADARRTG